MPNMRIEVRKFVGPSKSCTRRAWHSGVSIPFLQALWVDSRQTCPSPTHFPLSAVEIQCDSCSTMATGIKGSTLAFADSSAMIRAYMTRVLWLM